VKYLLKPGFWQSPDLLRPGPALRGIFAKCTPEPAPTIHYAPAESLERADVALIDAATRDDHAAFIVSWLKVLKDDKRAIFTPASHPQKGRRLPARTATAGRLGSGGEAGSA
jgi:hypothetical protein